MVSRPASSVTDPCRVLRGGVFAEVVRHPPPQMNGSCFSASAEADRPVRPFEAETPRGLEEQSSSFAPSAFYGDVRLRMDPPRVYRWHPRSATGSSPTS